VTKVGSIRLAVPSADAMRLLGARIGRTCVGGDVVILNGDLGAGKTTLTQGIATGLGIDDAVTSPTFVIARVHQHQAAGPDLVHVDAYRLGSVHELDDLDIDADLERSVVVVEWGTGIAERLSATRIEVSIERPRLEGEETRMVTVRADGDRLDQALADVAEQWTGS
jgi:tRNA threonylcarbamoyladenosine biosynthesis protein TsaE